MSNVKPKLIKLHRSKKNRVLAGVFGGIAEYLGWSPSLFRWVFALSIPLTMTVSLFGGVVFYLIMWIVMPEATDESYIYQ